jgi:hypothetical protein
MPPKNIDAPKPMTQVIAALAMPQDEKMAREAISASIDNIIKKGAALSIDDCINGRLDSEQKRFTACREI